MPVAYEPRPAGRVGGGFLEFPSDLAARHLSLNQPLPMDGVHHNLVAQLGRVVCDVADGRVSHALYSHGHEPVADERDDADAHGRAARRRRDFSRENVREVHAGAPLVERVTIDIPAAGLVEMLNESAMNSLPSW